MLRSITIPNHLSSSQHDSSLLLVAQNLHKSFVLHHQDSIRLPVLENISLCVAAGDCLALSGSSGSGKSTLMRSLYSNYRVDAGEIWLQHEGHWVELTQLQPHELIEVRQRTVGYVSQFLRVIPRVSALMVAVEPLLDLGETSEVAIAKVQVLFRRLNLPERLWMLSPTTFSGGEKQRVNIARTFAVNYPILLLDEPTAALDATNREVVMELIAERKAQGGAIVGIFHDDQVRDRLCNRELTLVRHT